MKLLNTALAVLKYNTGVAIHPYLRCHTTTRAESSDSINDCRAGILGPQEANTVYLAVIKSQFYTPAVI